MNKVHLSTVVEGMTQVLSGLRKMLEEETGVAPAAQPAAPAADPAPPAPAPACKACGGSGLNSQGAACVCQPAKVDRDALKAKARALGVEFTERTATKTLLTKIAQAEAAVAAPAAPVAPAVPVAAPVAPAPAVAPVAPVPAADPFAAAPAEPRVVLTVTECGAQCKALAEKVSGGVQVGLPIFLEILGEYLPGVDVAGRNLSGIDPDHYGDIVAKMKAKVGVR